MLDTRPWFSATRKAMIMIAASGSLLLAACASTNAPQTSLAANQSSDFSKLDKGAVKTLLSSQALEMEPTGDGPEANQVFVIEFQSNHVASLVKKNSKQVYHAVWWLEDDGRVCLAVDPALSSQWCNSFYQRNGTIAHKLGDELRSVTPRPRGSTAAQVPNADFVMTLELATASGKRITDGAPYALVSSRGRPETGSVTSFSDPEFGSCAMAVSVDLAQVVAYCSETGKGKGSFQVASGNRPAKVTVLFSGNRQLVSTLVELRKAN